MDSTDATITLLNDYRERRKEFRRFDDYDTAMEGMRKSVTDKIAIMHEPLKSIAYRIFSITDKGFFLIQVCEWKLDYIAEATIHSIQAKNPISLALNVRALVEHMAALVAIAKELQKFHRKLRGQSQEKEINQALDKAETYLNRAYYGRSPKVTKKRKEQAPHIADCLAKLKEDVGDIGEVYDFLCEYVHPNHGSNALVSSGLLGSGRLNPPEDFHRETLDRLLQYCSLSMLFLKDRGIEYGLVILELKNLFDLCTVKGARINNVFSIKEPNPKQDGKTKETAFHFPKARSKFEAMSLAYEFLAKNGYDVKGQRIGAMEGEIIYDLISTNKGEVWFKTPLF